MLGHVCAGISTAIIGRLQYAYSLRAPTRYWEEAIGFVIGVVGTVGFCKPLYESFNAFVLELKMLTKTDNLTIDIMLVEKLIYDSKLQGVIDAWNRIFKEYVAEALKPSRNSDITKPCPHYIEKGCCEPIIGLRCGDIPCQLAGKASS